MNPQPIAIQCPALCVLAFGLGGWLWFLAWMTGNLPEPVPVNDPEPLE